MYYRVKILSKEPVRFPSKKEYENINAALGLLFENAGDDAYDLVEKYVTDAFEYEKLEEFMQNLQTFAIRAEKGELIRLMSLLTEGHWEQLSTSPTLLEPEQMEHAASYWFLNNIMSVAAPQIIKPIDALSIKVEVHGNGEDALLTMEDTGKYGEIYPFATRLMMDATSSKGKIGTYELKGPILEYFEKLKDSGINTLPSDEAYDFDVFVDDTGGIIWSASVIRDPIEDAEDGEDLAVYEILIHPDWLGGEISSNFETYPYSDFS